MLIVVYRLKEDAHRFERNRQDRACELYYWYAFSVDILTPRFRVFLVLLRTAFDAPFFDFETSNVSKWMRFGLRSTLLLTANCMFPSGAETVGRVLVYSMILPGPARTTSVTLL